MSPTCSSDMSIVGAGLNVALPSAAMVWVVAGPSGIVVVAKATAVSAELVSRVIGPPGSTGT